MKKKLLKQSLESNWKIIPPNPRDLLIEGFKTDQILKIFSSYNLIHNSVFNLSIQAAIKIKRISTFE